MYKPILIFNIQIDQKHVLTRGSTYEYTQALSEYRWPAEVVFTAACILYSRRAEKIEDMMDVIWLQRSSAVEVIGDVSWSLAETMWSKFFTLEKL